MPGGATGKMKNRFATRLVDYLDVVPGYTLSPQSGTEDFSGGLLGGKAGGELRHSPVRVASLAVGKDTVEKAVPQPGDRFLNSFYFYNVNATFNHIMQLVKMRAAYRTVDKAELFHILRFVEVAPVEQYRPVHQLLDFLKVNVLELVPFGQE